jgi:hypothetical protein
MFVAGYEFERTGTPIKSRFLDLDSYANPPRKPVLIPITDDLKLTQVALGFDSKAKQEAGYIEYAVGYVDPFEVVSIEEGAAISFTEPEFKAAVATCKSKLDSIMEIHRSNPGLLEDALKGLNKKRKRAGTLTVAQLREELGKRDADTTGLKAVLEERLSALLECEGISLATENTTSQARIQKKRRVEQGSSVEYEHEDPGSDPEYELGQ